MTRAFIVQLTALPASRPAELRAGAWRLGVAPEAIVDVSRGLLLEMNCTLLLMAGEDRRRLSDEWRVHYLFGHAATHQLIHIEVILPTASPEIPTLAALSFPASRFEREIRDLVGITPSGHPDPRPLMRHGFWPDSFHPLREDAVVPDFEDDGRAFPFTQVEGEGVFEIPVGPVHAGVIEPGHFRFSVLGETILKMRARLYFTHKGIEKLFAGRTPQEGVTLAERISGDTSVGHAVAYCQAVETMTGTDIPDRARWLRVVLLELERLYNHITDVGAIIADAGFPVGQGHCMRLRERLLRINKRLTGHRLLRGVVIPGGVRWPASADERLLNDLLQPVVADFHEIVEICLENTLVRDRLEETGRLDPTVARDFGVVGYVARASGVRSDARSEYPDRAYQRLDPQAVVESGTDVRARTLVRIGEVQQALRTIERALDVPAPHTTMTELRTPIPFEAGFGVVEGWRGRIAHMVIANGEGRLHRVKVVDPSFFNWPALARALEDNIVPDFPLCNKSFNQSYSGNDL